MKQSIVKTLLVILLGIMPYLGYAEVPGTMSYQGYLSDTADKTISITFSIPGTSWTETHTGVQVNKQGVFGVMLGTKKSLTNVDFSKLRELLQVEYNGTTQKAPVASVPYAFHARTVESGSTGGGGSVFIRWGNGTAPNGTTLLYSGFGFNGRYSQGGGGAEPTCMKAGDTGAPGPGGNYGDLLYPLGTGNAARMPPGISPKTEIKCAVSYAEGPLFEMWGNDSCPTGWNAAYTGYGMGAHYIHGNLNRHCVDNMEYDYSVTSKTDGGILYGTVLHKNDDVGTYETNRYVKCAVCIKN